MNRKISVRLLLLLLWLWFMGTLAFGWAVWRIKTSRQGANTAADRAIIMIASSPTLLKESIAELNRGSNLIASDFYPDINGLKAAGNFVDDGYLLLATFSKAKDQSIVKLIRLADQKLIYQWAPDYRLIIESAGGQNKDWDVREQHNLRLYHPLLLPDGSLIFNNLFSPLIKIDRYSKMTWCVNGIYHHSMEPDAQGNIWVPSVIKPSSFFSNMLTGLKDDAITEISPDGKVMFRKSVAQILYDNGYGTLMFGTGLYEKDMLHVNEIKPALISGKYWLKGDLLISARNKSTIFLYRPSTNKILWLQTGPWLNQHDARFVDSTSISVFGNDMVRVFGDERLLNGYNNEYIFDFKTGKVTMPYTRFLKNAKVSTTNEGLARVLPNGDLFVEETNKNRLLRGSKNGTIWQYVDRIDDHSVAALSLSAYITKGEFDKLTFLKGTQQ